MEASSAKKLLESHNGPVPSSEDIVLHIRSEAPFLSVRAFSEMSGICHGFSTCLGGVSSGIYESMNLGLNSGDDREKVLRNYSILGESIGIDHRRISCPDQVHKTNILHVTEADAGDGIIRKLTHSEIDAQITDVPGIPLVVYSADCVPVLFADPVRKVIATCHAGWRGTVQGIAARVVRDMVESYGCEVGNIHALIGPSIGPDNYEVDDTVIDKLYESPYIDMSEGNLVCEPVDGSEAGDVNVSVRVNDKSRLYSIFRAVKTKNRFMLSLWDVNEAMLYNAGLRAEHIHNTRLCTFKYHELFFSHRYTKGRRGLNAGIISLKPVSDYWTDP